MVDDGYLIGYEDGSGNFVEVGRFNNAAEDTSQPILIEHTASGKRMELDGSGFDMSGDIAMNGNDIENAGSVSAGESTITDRVDLESRQTGQSYLNYQIVSPDGATAGQVGLSQFTDTVDTTTTDILDMSGFTDGFDTSPTGALVLVSGRDAGDYFADLLLVTGSGGGVSVIASESRSTPANRTYSLDVDTVQLSMDSGSYSVDASAYAQRFI